MENTRSKNKKHKSYAKQKPKSITDDVDEKEPQILSSVDRIRASHSATTPISQAGNIVDMQGSLDHGSVDKTENEKAESKLNKDGTGDGNEDSKAINNQETSEKQENNKSVNSQDVKSDVENTVVNGASENAENKIVSDEEIKNTEKDDTVDQKNTTDDASESSAKQSVLECQGICFFFM